VFKFDYSILDLGLRLVLVGEGLSLVGQVSGLDLVGQVSGLVLVCKASLTSLATSYLGPHVHLVNLLGQRGLCSAVTFCPGMPLHNLPMAVISSNLQLLKPTLTTIGLYTKLNGTRLLGLQAHYFIVTFGVNTLLKPLRPSSHNFCHN